MWLLKLISLHKAYLLKLLIRDNLKSFLEWKSQITLTSLSKTLENSPQALYTELYIGTIQNIITNNISLSIERTCKLTITSIFTAFENQRNVNTFKNNQPILVESRPLENIRLRTVFSYKKKTFFEHSLLNILGRQNPAFVAILKPIKPFIKGLLFNKSPKISLKTV